MYSPGSIIQLSQLMMCDTMENKQLGIIAVVVVVIVIVAGAAVALTKNNSNGSDKKTYEGIQTGCNLWVYGNVNGDDKIDNSDVALLEKIVAGTEQQVFIKIYDGYNAYGVHYASVSLADANGDGKITSDDVTKVKEIISYFEKYSKAVTDGTLSSFTDTLKLYYENCDLKMASVNLPVQHLGVVYYTNSEVVRLLGATDRVVLSDNTTINNHSVMLPEYQRADITNVGDTRFNLNAETLLTAYEDQGMTALFTGSSSTYSDGLESKVGDKIDVIRLPAWEDNNFMAGTLTLGYILGSTTTAYKYIDWANGVIDKISTDLKGVELTNIICAKGRVADLLAGNGNGSGRSEITEWAGANNMVTTITPVTSEYPTITKEWAVSKNPQAIILSGNCGYEKSTAAAIKTNMYDVYDAAVSTYAGTDAAKNGKIYIITDDIMTGPAAIVGLAYAATLLHPDQTKNIDANAIFQEYVNNFGLGSSYKVTDHIDQFIYKSA